MFTWYFLMWGYWFCRKDEFALSFFFVEGSWFCRSQHPSLESRHWFSKDFFGAWPWGPLLNRGVQHPLQLQGGSWMVRVTETWGLFFRRKSPMSNEMLPDGRMNFHHITAYSNRPWNWLGRIPKKCSYGTEIGPLHLWTQPGLSNPTTGTRSRHLFRLSDGSMQMDMTKTPSLMMMDLNSFMEEAEAGRQRAAAQTDGWSCAG